MKKVNCLSVVILLCISSNLFAGDCKEHIALHSAAYLANEYGKSEMWVLSNVKINLWEKPSHLGKGKKVGQMYPGSRALILKTEKEDYQVKSPLDKSVGWVNKIQVSKTLFQDTKTREACAPPK
ncbi:MAG: hypothetical protein HQ528_07040 [Candidatus Marinimicrobia bacterium]|nr:hypothetical protein [Candidatus Neomarinimicrobiota bacterium]